MPCRLIIKVRQARGLPVMDKPSESTDAYCEVKFASLAPQKTKIIPKSLNPEWKQEFRFEVLRDKHLQDAPVEFKVFDHDVVHDDIIGGVNVDINCLLPRRGPGRISGWFPLYDSIRGVRGSLNFSIKVEFIDNSNEFRETAAGVKFYSISDAMPKYKIASVIGFVEELVVEDDPEYQSFSFSKARTTNEQRRNIFYHMSGKLRRKIGLATQDLGGNAVLGYRQCFDLEGDSGKGIVARGYGTACLLARDTPISDKNIICSASISPSPDISWLPTSPRVVEQPLLMGVNFTSPGQIHLISLINIPPSITVQIGGIVSTKAVKHLKKTHRRRNRDKWWSAVRSEIRGHAKALRCNTVFGYYETTTIEEDVVILSAYGTACRVLEDQDKRERKPKPADDSEKASEKRKDRKDKKEKKRKKKSKKRCIGVALHSPLGKTASKGLKLCRICQKAAVGDVVLSSLEPPPGVMIVGAGTILQSRVCRKYKSEGKVASFVSSAIPLLEYDLYRQILYKMKLVGANACFRLQIQINLGNNMIIAVATGTAVLIHGLPLSDPLRPVNAPAYVEKYFETRDHLAKYFADELSDPIVDEVTEDSTETGSPYGEAISTDDVNDCFLKLVDPPLPEDMLFCTTQYPPLSSGLTAIESQLILSFVRISWDPPTEKANEYFASIVQQNFRKIIFELCEYIPCTLCGLQIQVSLPNECEIDFLVTGTAIKTLQPPSEFIDFPLDISGEQDPLIFPLDQPDTLDLRISVPDDSSVASRTSTPLRASMDTMVPIQEPSGDGIIVTNLEYIPGRSIKRYIGRISHHLIRETKEKETLESAQLPGRNRLGNLASVFLREAISVARAHVIGMGGNALIGFNIDNFSLVAAQAKSGYCLISFSGDAVLLTKPRQ